MKEINITLNQAILIWWFITWRLILVMLVSAIAVNTILELFLVGDLLYTASELIQALINVGAMIFFIKSAVNRNYLSKSSGSFRLTAIELDQDAIDADPRFAYKKGPQPIDMSSLQK